MLHIAPKPVRKKTGPRSTPKSVEILRDFTKVRDARLFLLSSVLTLNTWSENKCLNRWPSWKTRRDQLIFLEIVANAGWVALPELKKTERESLQDLIRNGTTKPISKEKAAPYRPDSTISVVDMVSHRRLVFRHGITVAQYNLETWPWLNVGWHRRIQSCAMDAEKNPNDVVIVEAQFPFDEQFVMWVFAKMTFNPNAEKEKRYKMVTSAYRLK